MAHRIEIGLKRGVPDARGKAVAAKARTFLGIPVKSCQTRDVYKVDVPMKPGQLRKVRQAFTDPVVARCAAGRLKAPAFDWLVEVGFKPGVTDNLGHTAEALVEDQLDRHLSDEEGVYTSTQYFLKGPELTHEHARQLGEDLLANSLIQDIRVFSSEEWAQSEIDEEPPVIRGDGLVEVKTYDLGGSDDDLMRISREGILSLTLEEMQAVRDHYRSPEVQEARRARGMPDWPTDVEMECIAQTWSEHCKHKIFAADISYTDDKGRQETIHSLFKTFIKKSTEEIAERVDWLVSVFTDNAGIVRFNEHINLAIKAETHNSPSALDPYGGAITGIVGCNRDPMGTGKGCELLYNTWGYCLGSPFYDGDVPEGLMHPRRIRDGVHEGVIDGGNQSGIPWARGFEIFDDRFIGKPLVYCGTIGKLPPVIDGVKTEVKEVHPGDAIVMVGGRIGKDGIHGATFSSAELDHESPAQAVQIGDPITQRMMYEFLLEARDQNLYRTITDNGAGGLSSSIGEMCTMSGGAELDLAAAPLKYQGLQPWEIFVSESQERMSLAVPQEKVQALKKLAEQRDVELSVLGTFTDKGALTLKHGDQLVAQLDMDFLHDGCPKLYLEAVWNPPSIPEPVPLRKGVRSKQVRQVLSRLNVCSREYKSRMYDAEVKGLSIVKPFVGVGADTPSDATVLLAEQGGTEGVVISEGINPFYSDLDTYHMMTSCVDLAVRRIISTGGRWGSICGLDNFCWPDPVESEKTPDGKYKLAQLVRANQGLYDITTSYDVPCVSGKDSMKNDSVRGGRKISIPPTVLFTAMGKLEHIRKAVTVPFKQAGDLIFVVGWTSKELGASEFYRMLAEQDEAGGYGGQVPRVDMETAKTVYKAMNRAADLELLSSSHTPHLGGLAIGFSMCCLGGHLGAEVELDLIPSQEKLGRDEQLFSESNSRFIVTCRPDKREALRQVFAGLPISEVGHVTGSGKLVISSGEKPIVQLSTEEIAKCFKGTLDGI